MEKKTEFFLTVGAYALVGSVVSMITAIRKKKEEKRQQEIDKQVDDIVSKSLDQFRIDRFQHKIFPYYES